MSITDSTDYYELLEVDEAASPAELKKAYRRAAMRWHPDRNPGNVEEATRVFQIIEHAYSILSDPHERAWYDGHRNISMNEFGEFAATSVDINKYFGAGAFNGFNDGPNGFYSVFRDAFQTLANEEKNKDAPSFGDSKTCYEDVNKFYSFWTCFTTKRSFAFEDLFNLKDAPNARYKRRMKQENEKVRQKAQREFVQSVREMALFAKKRDPRVKKHLEEVEAQLKERQLQEEKRKIEKQKEFERQMKEYEKEPHIQYNESDIIYLREFDEEPKEFQWKCEYCGRDMNTETAFLQHCKTKKHKKMCANAKKDFLRDPSLYEHDMFTFTLLGLDDDEIEEATGKSIDQYPPLSSHAKPQEKKFSRSSGKLHEKNINNEQESENENQEEESETESPKKKSNSQNNKKEQVQQQQNRPKLTKKELHKLKVQKQKEAKEKAEAEKEQQQQQNNKAFASSDQFNCGRKLSKKEKKRLKQLEEARQRLMNIEAEEEEEEDHKDEQNENNPSQETLNEETNPENVEYTENEEHNETEENEAENPAQTETPEQEIQNQNQKGKKNKKPKLPRKAPPGMFMCRKCRQIFPSKTKLFKHLKETNHATAFF